MYHDPNLNRIGVPREVAPGGYTPPKGARAPDSGEADFSFGDLVDLVNPLQHIPGVNTIYRHLTGDEIDGHIRVMGGALWGGPVGFVAGLGSAISQEASGRDPGEHLLAAVLGDDAVARHDSPAAADVQLAMVDDAGAAPAEAAATQEMPPRAVDTPASGAAGEGEVLSGANALAAFARDLGATSTAARQDQAASARRTDTAPDRADVQPEGPGPDARFFPLDDTNIASASAYASQGHGRSNMVERGLATATPGGLVPAAAAGGGGGRNTRPAGAESGISEIEMERELIAAQRARSDQGREEAADRTRRSPEAAPQEAGAPAASLPHSGGLTGGDFASRMMEALDRYRAMGVERSHGREQLGQAMDSAF